MNGVNGITDDHAGAVDNRLSLDPADDRWSGPIGTWRDGETYEITSLKIRQISPGEFEVVSVNMPGASESEAVADKGRGGEGDSEKDAGDYPTQNPAVRRMLKR